MAIMKQLSIILPLVTLLAAVVLAASAQQDIDRWEEHDVYMENIPRDAEKAGQKIRQHLRTSETYRLLGYSLDGKNVLFSRGGEIYRYNGGRRPPKEIVDKSWSLNSARIVNSCGEEAYLTRRDTNGDEYHRIYLTKKNESKRERIAEGKARRVSLSISDDRSWLAYAQSPEESGYWEVVMHQLCDNMDAIPIIRFDDTTRIKDWSPDNHQLIVTVQGDEENRLIIVDVGTGEQTILATGAEPFVDALFSHDGQSIIYTSSNGADNIIALQMHIESREITDISSDIKLDIDRIVLSPDRTHLAVIFNWLGLNQVVLMDAVTLQPLNNQMTKSPGFVTGALFSPDNSKLLMRLSQPAVPISTVVYGLEDGSLETWTGGANSGLALFPEVINYPTFDMFDGQNRRISALLYLPPQLGDGEQAPVLINAHGGPASQHRPSFNRTIHYYVTQMGIAVLEPNIRGSSGYGKAFEELDNGIKREDSIKDIGALLDWIEAHPQLNSDRVVIAGGSYGGYVSLAALTKYSDRLRGGISRVGISDFKTFLENTERNRVNNRRREYGDERNPVIAALFEEISPIQNAHDITAPLLVVQGANDPRVPAAQADLIKDAVRENGVTVWYLLSKKDGHSITNSNASRLSSGAQVRFLETFLLSD